MQQSDIARNIEIIRNNIAQAEKRRGIPAGSVTLLAAAKQNDAERVREAIRAGITVVGENRVQEMTEKLAQSAYEGAELHFIGHLQRNKVKKVVGVCSLIHSVGTVALAREISKAAVLAGLTQDVLIEVNIGAEPTKTGFLPGEVCKGIEEVAQLENIRIKGLMTIPPAEKEENVRKYFSQMYQLFVDITSKKYDNVYMDTLSMGMSGDYAIAIEEGSNLVRVGFSIFGVRA